MVLRGVQFLAQNAAIRGAQGFKVAVCSSMKIQTTTFLLFSEHQYAPAPFPLHSTFASLLSLWMCQFENFKVLSFLGFYMRVKSEIHEGMWQTDDDWGDEDDGDNFFSF